MDRHQNQSEERYRRLFENAAEGIFRSTPSGEILDANPAFARMLGYDSVAELKAGVTDFDKQFYVDRQVGVRFLRQLDSGNVVQHFELEFYRKDGSKGWASISAHAARDQNGNVSCYEGIAEDITEGRRVEMALRASQRLLQDMIDHWPAVIDVQDLQGRFMLVNRGFEEVTHLSRESVLGRTFADVAVIPKPRVEQFREFNRQVLAAGRALDFELTIPFDDGPHTLLFTKAPLRDDSGQPYAICSISRDITEHKRLEEQLRKAQKMEAMGQLAGGIAHDFNNLITIITGYSELLHKALESDPALQAKVGEIYKAGEQANSLTRQLLAFSRRQMLQTRLLDLSDILRDMENMLRRVLSEDIELMILTDSSLGLIRSDRGQVEQVIMNLVINARDAMPRGGKLILSAGNTVLDDSYARSHVGVSPGAYVRLMVKDTGCGMDASTLSRIFEPFFTTKEQGKGTGLGLATVYGIVQQAGGHIAAESEPGKGSSFHIFLPRSEGTIAPEMESIGRPAAAGSETILLVEDQDGLRVLLTEILQRRGYSVLPASNGRDALLLAEHHEGVIDLLVTDLVMPQMGGREVSERLARSRPRTPVLYMSGYSEKAFALSPGQALLPKPFHPEVLLRKVRELLDRPTESAHSA